MNYQQDFPNVLFTTFKPLPANKEEPQRPPSADSHLVISKEVKAVIQDGDRKMESRKNEVPPSQNGAPKDNSRNPVGTLKEQTHNWFEKTQRMRLIKNGVFPEWFHGFVTRKKTEEMLEVKPPGCFLIRFCESRVGFVLSYRGAERCRHFMLDLLQDDRYVIEGEDSAHRSLQELIDHYHVYPVEPHKERLTTACAKKAIRKDCSGPLQNQADENKKEKMYSSVAKEATVPSDPKLSTPVFPEEREDVLAKIKIKKLLSKDSSGSLQNQADENQKEKMYSSVTKGGNAPSGPKLSPSNSLEAREDDLLSKIKPKVKNLSPPPRTKQPISREESLKYSVQETEPAAYALVKKMPAGTAQNKSRTPLAEDPYSTLEELHTYSDLPGWVAEDPQLFNEMQEPIAFYAMGRGSCKNNQENIYSEVDLHAVASHGLQKGSSCGATTTTHPKAINKPLKKTTPFHSSFRQKKQSTLQLEDCGRSWENSLKPLSESKVSKTRKNKKLQFDDPTYAKPIQHQVVPQLSPNQEEDPEDIYEKIKDDCVQMSKNNRSANNKPS
ncbi:hypothetical protein XENTR_v10022445 [Xenopus tropicalis]|uniref:SH2 domain containing 2A n=1 Tax=Xenopus tropicalis TaxID=8364 RepID=A0A6I8R473_XENTR|nr:SH2 domain-containing protein 2A [Xenopus tropicalis]KAE8588277.1 hypothetical protein XENTR_v10022445 [Xenopus tropicalis]